VGVIQREWFGGYLAVSGSLCFLSSTFYFLSHALRLPRNLWTGRGVRIAHPPWSMATASPPVAPSVAAWLTRALLAGVPSVCRQFGRRLGRGPARAGWVAFGLRARRPQGCPAVRRCCTVLHPDSKKPPTPTHVPPSTVYPPGNKHFPDDLVSDGRGGGGKRLEGGSSGKPHPARGSLSAVAFLGPESAASARTYMVE
jgi:hypothetical protein